MGKKDEKDEGLGAGAIVGIVIGSLALVAIVVAVVFYFIWKRKSGSESEDWRKDIHADQQRRWGFERDLSEGRKSDDYVSRDLIPWEAGGEYVPTTDEVVEE